MAPGLHIALAAGSQRHHDVQGLLATHRLATARAGAVEQEAITGCCNFGVSLDVVDLDHQLAALAVDIQHAGLEDGFLVPRIEGLEGHEVAQQGDQAVAQANQLVQLDQAIRRLGHGLVLFHQRQQARLGALLHQFKDTPTLQHIGNRHLRRLGAPGQVVAAQRDQMLPLLARQAVLLAVDRHHHTLVELVDGALPGRVEPLAQRQVVAMLHHGQRQAGYFAGIGQRQRGQTHQLFFLGVHQRGRTRIELGHGHAGEIVVNLAAHRAQRLDRRHRTFTKGVQPLLGSAGMPGMQLARLIEESSDLLDADGRLAAAVSLRAEAGDDVGDGGLELGILGQGCRHQAVAIGLLRREQLRQIGGIARRQIVAIRPPEHAQQALGGQTQVPAHGIVSERGKLQRPVLKQHGGVTQTRQRPVHHIENFRRADTTVIVQVDVLQHAPIQLQVVHRAGQAGPEFLVKAAQRGEVGGGFQLYLVEAASTEEAPAMRESLSHLQKILSL